MRCASVCMVLSIITIHINFMKKIQTLMAVAAFGAVAIVPFAASAQVTTTADAGTSVSTTAKLTPAERMQKIITAVNTHVDKRVATLDKVSSRVTASKKLTADEKTSLMASLSQDVTALTTLRAKIDADTDLKTMKADRVSLKTAMVQARTDVKDARADFRAVKSAA